MKANGWTSEELAIAADFIEVDPESPTGLRWKQSQGRAKKGRPAGSLNPNGYYTVYLRGKRWSAHRLVLLLSGEHPPTKDAEADHVDRNRQNNRIENLRWVNHARNTRRRQTSVSNRTGYPRVFKQSGAGTYVYMIKHEGKLHYKGRFRSPETAYYHSLAKRLELDHF